MKKETSKVRYFLYARKSSESEDRQVQSIDDQINRLKRLANDLHLQIVEIITEAKSAKKPNNRPIFDEMLRRIEKGEADGILTWSINRVSRNPIDSGKISWLLQQGVLKSIQTIDRQYLPDDNVLLLNVESGVANQFILDLSKNVKRGIQSKLEKGWRPGSATTGYINDLATHTILKDSERFPLLRRAWELMLTGNYTVSQILDTLNNEWGYRSIKRKRSGGFPMSKSGLYRIFTSVFYAGVILHNGQEYAGKHEPMITLEEYDRVQMILGRKGKPRHQKHTFAFTGTIHCEECGCLYTAEKKKKIIKSTGEIKEYTYYHCTRKKTNVDCSQRKVIREDAIEYQIDEELEKYTILPEFRDWALEILNSKNDTEIEDRSKIHENLSNAVLTTQQQLDNLTKMRYRDQITDEEYSNERNALQREITSLREKLRETETRADKWLELTEKTFNFATYARKAFLMGDAQTKREIFSALGQNPTIKDGKLRIHANEWLQPIKDHYPELETEYKRLEPYKECFSIAQNEAFTSLSTRWQGRRDSNPK